MRTSDVDDDRGSNHSNDWLIDTFFEATLDGAILSTNGVVRRVNKAAIQILGLETEADCIGKALNLVLDEMGAAASEVPSTRVVRRASDQEWIELRVEERSFETAGETTSLAIIRDVSPESERLEAMRAVELRWRFALISSGNAIWEYHPKQDRPVFSNSWWEMIGYTPGVDPEVGALRWHQLVHPDDFEAAWGAQSAHIEGKTDHYIAEFRMRCKDGSWKWILSRGQVITRDENGKATYMIGTHSDIDVLKRAEAMMRLSEARYRRLFNLSPTGVFVIQNNRITLANNGLARLLGYDDPSDFVGKPTLEIIAPEYHQAVVSKARNPKRYELRNPERRDFLRRDGSRVACEVVGQYDFEEGIESLIVVVTDVSERLESEERLRESEERWQFALDGADSGVWDWDVSKNVGFWSPRWKEMLGYEPEDKLVVDAVEDFQRLVHPDDFDQAWTKQVAHLNGESPSYIADFRMLCKDGSWKWIQSRGKVTSRDENGNALRFVGTHTDISERMRHEAEITRLNAQLTDRARQLEATVQELETFSYTVSHDLRSPLRSIDGFAAAIEEDFGSLLPEAAHSDLARVRAAARRMGELIDDILALSRVTRREMEPVPCDLAEIAREVSQIHTQLGAKGVEFKIPNTLPAVADPSLMRVLLDNLIGNAIKFTKERERATIEFGMREEDGRSVYFVKDNGAGFDPSFQNRLFKPFERLHDPRRFAGHGIGLATAQRCVSRHGGRIWAEGAPEQGATFYFTLYSF